MSVRAVPRRLRAAMIRMAVQSSALTWFRAKEQEVQLGGQLGPFVGPIRKSRCHNPFKPGVAKSPLEPRRLQRGTGGQTTSKHRAPHGCLSLTVASFLVTVLSADDVIGSKSGWGRLRAAVCPPRLNCAVRKETSSLRESSSPRRPTRYLESSK